MTRLELMTSVRSLSKVLPSVLPSQWNVPIHLHVSAYSFYTSTWKPAWICGNDMSVSRKLHCCKCIIRGLFIKDLRWTSCASWLGDGSWKSMPWWNCSDFYENSLNKDLWVKFLSYLLRLSDAVFRKTLTGNFRILERRKSYPFQVTPNNPISVKIRCLRECVHG